LKPVYFSQNFLRSNFFQNCATLFAYFFENMTAILLDGKALAEEILEKCRKEAEILNPTLAVILVGNDPASEIYVSNKKKSCEKAGVRSVEILFPETVSEDELLAKIAELNANPEITAFIVQMPLPAHIDAQKVIDAIAPEKDADGFHPQNLGNVFLGREKLPPATPAGIISLLEKYDIEISGKKAVVVGRSNTVGKPVATMLLNRGATTTICHSRTKNLAEETRSADILVVALGKPKFITADMVKVGAVVIDVGIHRLETGKLCGDTDFENIREKVSFVTPVPGGVGPMTVASLVQNTISAAKNHT